MTHAAEPMPPLAFRVGRYSANDGDRQLERQQDDTLKLCELHGYEDGGWFGVDDESGNVDTRRRQGKVDDLPTIAWAKEKIGAAKELWPNRPVVLVAWKESRLWRDVSMKEEVRRWLGRWRDVTWHTTEGLKNPNSATDTLVSTVVAGGNQFYADSVRELVVGAHRARAAQLKPATGWPGFGHRREVLSDDGRGNIVLSDRWIAHEIEAPLVRDAATRILDGTPIAHILREWVDRGVPSKLGGTWTLTSMRRIFTAPRLAGILVFSGEELGPSPYIEALIDEPTLRLLQHRLTRRKNTRHRIGMQVLTGVLVCGTCGGRLNSTIKGSRPPTRSYACLRHGHVSIKAAAVERVLKATLFLALERAGANDVEVDTTAEVEDLLRELTLVEREELDLGEIAAELPVAVLHAKASALSERKATLTEAITDTANANERAGRWFVRRREIQDAWESYSVDMKRAIFFDVIGQVAVDPGGSGHNATDEVVSRRLRRLEGPIPEADRQPPVVGRPRKRS